MVVTANDEPCVGPIDPDALATEAGADRRSTANLARSSPEPEPGATHNMTTITRIHGREILDSRGNPTVEVDVWAGDVLGRAAVPSGASTGEREALELRDGDKTRYLGKGVRTAVAHVNGEIAQALVGTAARPARRRPGDDRARRHADQEPARRQRAAGRVDGGGACRRAGGEAAALRAPRALAGTAPADAPYVLPVPMMNILNGGAHADSSVDLQEFMVMPVGMPTFAEALRAGAEIFHALRAILKKAGHSTGVGDEGGFAPSLKSNQEALDVVLEAIGKAGYTAGEDVFLALDVASSELWDDGRYVFKKSGEPTRTPDEMVRDVRRTGCGSIRSSRSRTAWPKTTGPAGRRSPGRSATACSSWATTCSSPTPRSCERGIAEGVGNSILVKLNQIGTVTETLDAIAMARAAGYTTVISHRRAKPRTRTIADLAVGTSAGQIKTGSASRSDRVAKYNQLLRIEEELGAGARYAGRSALRQLAGRA